MPAPGVDAKSLYAELFALAQEEMAYFKAPGWFAAVEKLPLTGTQKLQRGALQSLLHTMYVSGALVDFRHQKSRSARAAR